MEKNLGSAWADGNSRVSEPPAGAQNSQLKTVHKALKGHYIDMTVGLQGVGAGGAQCMDQWVPGAGLLHA